MLSWRKTLIVIRREFVTRVRTKAFWISTLAVPFLLVVFSFGPALLVARASGKFNIGIVTRDTELFRLAVKNVEKGKGSWGNDSLEVTFQLISPREDGQRQREELKQQVLAKTFAAVVVVPETLEEGIKLEYLSPNVTAFKLMGTVEQALDRAIREIRLKKAEVSEEVRRKVLASAELLPVKVEKGGVEKAGSSVSTFFVAYILMFVVWVTVMMYGMQVMRGVLEEKSSRIVEVIAANLSPMELMFGKILGVGAVGLTQYAIWMVLAMNTAILGASAFPSGAVEVFSNFGFLAVFVSFYVLGYFLYGSLFAAIGAAFNSEEEAQQIQNIAGWITAVPFLCMPVVINNPDSLFSAVVSFIPFFAPSLYLLRLVLHTPPLWQTLTCLALLSVTTYWVAWLAAAVYRIGILSYGSRPSLKQLWCWARQR